MFQNFIAKIRNIIADNTTLALTDVFTPYLPQDDENICCVTLLAGSTINNLCELEYNDVVFRILVRGNSNDTTTRALVDEIFTVLHLKTSVSFTGGKIINIVATSTPVYVGIDENERILYNITFNAKVKGD